MPINANIAMGFQPPPPIDPLNNLAKFAALQQAQEQQQMNALKMQEYQRSVDEQNQLRQYLAGGMPDKEEGLLRYGAAGRGAYESLLKGRRESRESDKAFNEALVKRMEASRMLLDGIQTPQDFIAWHEGNHRDPIIGRFLAERGVTADASRARIQQALQTPEGFSQLLEESKVGATKMLDSMKPVSVAAGSTLVNPRTNQPVFTAPVTPPTSVQEYEYGQDNPAFTAERMALKRAGASSVKVNLPEQEKAFETELGKEQAKSVVESRKGAEDAAEIIRTVQQGRKILNSGVITGAGADFLVSLNQGLKQAGLDFGYADASANSQAFAANMAQSVGKFIKQFGAGTGLSDADREYAKEMAAGKISLDRKAIERILSLNEKASRNIIQMHNKKSAGIKTNIPLTVEMPADEAAIPDAPPPGAVRLKGK